MTESKIDWRMEIYDCLREHDIEQVCHVPDAGHAALIRACEADNSMTVIGLTSEQDGVGVLTGAWLGGQRGVLLMQSSGVGNTINALAMPNACRIPPDKIWKQVCQDDLDVELPEFGGHIIPEYPKY